MELRNRVTEQFVTTAAITKQWVIDRTAQNIIDAAADKQYSVVNKALELIGTELGMFVKKTETKIDLPDDIAQLSDEQLLQLQHWAERLKYGKDTRAIMEARRRAGILELEAGEVTDAEPEAKEEDELQQTTGNGDGW